MLRYGRLAGQLSRIARHSAGISVDPLGRSGFINISCTSFSSKSKKSKTGITVKVEECVPTKTKQTKKVPPLPPPPPPPPPHSTAPPVPPPYAQKPTEPSIPLCDVRNETCPPNCPPIQQDECFKPGDDGPKKPEFKYWKHIIAAVVLAGVSAYAYLEWLKKPEKLVEDRPTCKVRQPIKRNPEDMSSIPQEVPYLLIGGGTAAFSAFRSIKARDSCAKVLVITSEGDLPYMRPPLSKELWYVDDEELASKLTFRQWNGKKRSLFYEPPEFYCKPEKLMDSPTGGVAVATGYTVHKIDVVNKTAYLKPEKPSDREYPIKYNKCLIATGATPKNLSIFEKAEEKIRDKIIVFRNKDCYRELSENVKKEDVKNIVIIGGGFLGSELSTSIARNVKGHDGKTVTQIYKENHILAQVLPEYLSEWTTKHLQAQGVKCIPNVEVHDCSLKGNQLLLTLSDGRIIEADQVVVAIGVNANTELAEESNLEIDPEEGGFIVNAELEARSYLWAAGDAACFYDVQLGRRRVEHHDHAVISGKLAGENMTGAGKPYIHQSMFWSDLGPEVGFEAIGIINSNLETVGVFAKVSDQATPLAAVTASDDNIRSNEKAIKNTSNKTEPAQEETKSICKEEPKKETAEIDNKPKDYEKGVIFYLRDNTVVGILLWNIFDRMPIARQLLKRGTVYDEINEAAKLFQIHND